MLFQGLEKFLKAADCTIAIHKAESGLVITVNFTPLRVKDDTVSRIKPLLIKNISAEEADEKFLELIDKPARQTQELFISLEDYEASVEKANAESKKKAEEKKKQVEVKKKAEEHNKKTGSKDIFNSAAKKTNEKIDEELTLEDTDEENEVDDSIDLDLP